MLEPARTRRTRKPANKRNSRARLDRRRQQSEDHRPLRSGAVPTNLPKDVREPTPGPSTPKVRRPSTNPAQKGPLTPFSSKNRGPCSSFSQDPKALAESPAPARSEERTRASETTLGPPEDVAANRSAKGDAFEPPRPSVEETSRRLAADSEEPPSVHRSASGTPGPRVPRAHPPRRPRGSGPERPSPQKASENWLATSTQQYLS